MRQVSGRQLLIATRSAPKLHEIREILRDVPRLEVVGADEAGIPQLLDEEEIEDAETFEENALAKARYFAARSGLPALADDSGLCVDELGGAPGVRSKRFAGRADLRGAELDAANNELLLQRLAGVPPERRTAHYLCALALVSPRGAETVVTGRCDGIVLGEPRGSGGFGYDPLFFLESEKATFAELPLEAKNRFSHRFQALHALRESLLSGLDPDTLR